MRISIITTVGKKVSGQNRVLLEYGQQLARNGHSVTLYKLRLRTYTGSLPQRLKLGFHYLSGKRVRGYRIGWFPAQFPSLIIPYLSDNFLPEADVLLFSSVSLIPAVVALAPEKGRRFFLVQCGFYSQAPKPLPPPNIEVIAISSLVRRWLAEKMPGRSIHLLVNGINLSQFSNPDKVFRPAQTIGMLFYQKRPVHKGLDDGLSAFQILREHYPYLRFRMAGEKRERWLPAWIEFWDGNNQQNLVKFYRSLDIFLYPSRLDACPLPPMEALACQCGLVTTAVGGVFDFTGPGKTALVCPPGDAAALVQSLTSLVEEPAKLKELAQAGYAKIKEFSYENQTQKLEKILSTVPPQKTGQCF